MTTKAKMTEQLVEAGWSLDRYGHLKKTKNGKDYRYKMQKISWRREVKRGRDWVRIGGHYYCSTGGLILSGV